MRHLVTVILVMLVLGAVVTGCDGMRHYDSRLTAADSLMRSAPDSALTIVDAISRYSLTDDGDRAYRDLLLTQARYRCYITATSDSDINRALAWYRAHPADREKLTRAYIYKGAVMEELNHPDSAMIYYKTAEATAAPDDYFNLGYSKMRIAVLYRDQLSEDSAAIINLKKAINCFELINDTNYLISCYGRLGGNTGLNAPDSNEYYLRRAIELAQLSNSTKQYTYKSKLAGLYLYYFQDYQQARDLSMDVFRNGQQFSAERQFYYYAAMSYLRLGLLDSAKYVFEATPQPTDAVDSMNRLDLIAEMAKAEKNPIEYSENKIRSKDIQIQIISNKKEEKLKKAETDYHRMQAETNTQGIKSSLSILICVLLLVALSALLLAWLAYHQRCTINKQKDESDAIQKELAVSIKELQEKQSKLLPDQNVVSRLVGYRLDALNELFNSMKFKYTEENGGNNSKVRRILSLASVVNGLSKNYRALNIVLSDSFWEKIKLSLDGEYNGIATFVEKNYPNLTTNEKHLLYLLCCRISPQIIKICMNYTNWKSVTNNRSIIIKKKMGLDMSLEEFIEKYMNNEL